jgi:hypothetical protein
MVDTDIRARPIHRVDTSPTNIKRVSRASFDTSGTAAWAVGKETAYIGLAYVCGVDECFLLRGGLVKRAGFVAVGVERVVGVVHVVVGFHDIDFAGRAVSMADCPAVKMSEMGLREW